MKELRLAGVNDIDAANAWLPTFVADYNRRFGRTPRSDKDLHRHLAPQDDLDSSFTWRVERTVSHALSLQYDRVRFLLEPSDLTRDLGGKRVTVYDYPDGRMEIRHLGRALPYRTLTWSAASTRAPSSRTSASSRRWSFAAGCRPNCRLSSGASPHLADQRSGNTSSPSPPACSQASLPLRFRGLEQFDHVPVEICRHTDNRPAHRGVWRRLEVTLPPARRIRAATAVGSVT